VLPLPVVPAVRLLLELLPDADDPEPAEPDADSLPELGELAELLELGELEVEPELRDEPDELDAAPLPVDAFVSMYEPPDEPALADDPLVPVAPASPFCTQPVRCTCPASLLLERLVCEPLGLVAEPLDPDPL